MQTLATAPDVTARDAIVLPSQDTSSQATMPEVLDLAPIIERLTARTNGADRTHVGKVVDDVARQFDNARVRSFLPVLILKEAQDRLRSVGMITTT